MRWLIGVCVLTCLTSQQVQAEDGFVPLFNGKNLDGWIQHGGEAKYTIEGNEIVGTSVPKTPNSFLCTKQRYSDFILEVDFKVDTPLNSGIQIRSNVFDKETTATWTDADGKEKSRKISAGRVHGYQVEIDPSDRAWSGGIYDEGRRGWLNNLEGDNNKSAREVFKKDDWNHYRVEAIGDSIKTFINGVPAADLKDGMTREGFIALQVHGVGKDNSKVGKQVRWRNIHIKDLSHTQAAAENEPQQWVTYPGGDGPGTGKKIVLISGDEEYRSEEVMPQLGKILSVRHGFHCTVLFPINPETGYIDANYGKNIPGLEALDDADLMIILTRFRDLPDEQMARIDAYLKRGGPVIGLRTATHAFNMNRDSPYAHYGNYYNGDKTAWKDGFGRLVLGEHWISHHGQHKVQSARGIFAAGAEQSPILTGIQSGEIWGPSDVYGVRLPLPGDSRPLVLGQVVNREVSKPEQGDPFYGMRETDKTPDPKKNDPMMPIVWTKSYQLPEGEQGQALVTTMGASTDIVNAGLRKLLVNGVYVLLGMEGELPEAGANVDLVGEYAPTAFEFRKPEYWNERKMTVSEHELP